MKDQLVYLSAWKLLAGCLVFWVWVRAADWINTDAYDYREPYLRWNGIVVGSFVAGFVLWLAIPWFFLGFPLLLTGLLGPLVSYVRERNERVPPLEQVFTPAHLRIWGTAQLAKVGIHIAPRAPDPYEIGPVRLAASGGPAEHDETLRFHAARRSPGFNPARELLAEAIEQRATAVVLECGVMLAARSYFVDGVWRDQAAMPLERATQIGDALATLSGLELTDGARSQERPFLITYDTNEFPAFLSSRSTVAGRRFLMQFTRPASSFADFEALGMRPKMQQQLKPVLDGPHGLFLLVAPPNAGLRTLTNVGLRSMDRLVREFVAVEELTRRQEPVENVPVVTYQTAAGESLAEILPSVVRNEPRVLVVRELGNQAALRLVCEYARTLQVVGTLRAHDAAEAVLRVANVHGVLSEFAASLNGVLCQKLVRKLCNACKTAVRVSAEIEQQWGLPAERVPAIFQPPPPTDEKGRPTKVCKVCGGVGYHGRTGIFELLLVNEDVRSELTASPNVASFRQTLVRLGMHSFQEEGLVLVAKGVTSLEELQRALAE